MGTGIVSVQSVGKTFAGRSVLENLTFDVLPGEVFALLGPNGAGKTTTVRMLVGIIRPDHGRIQVQLDGRTTDRLPAHRSGYLPEDRGLYRELPVLRSLIYFGMLRGLSRREARTRAHEWLERMGLLDRQNDRLDALSKGNQQRVQLIAAVLHGPAIAVLDEPFSGLDPLSQEFFLELVRELKQSGTTILLSAHQMDLVERVADRVLLLNHGRTILAGTPASLHTKLDARPHVRLTLESGSLADGLGTGPDVDEVVTEGEVVHVFLRPGAAPAAFLARAVGVVALRSIEMQSPRLHDLFVRAVREDDAREASVG